MSNKDKKATRAALRDFLVAIPGTLDRAATAMGRMVWLGVVVLVLIAAGIVFMPHHHREPPPGGNTDNASGALYVRDLGRLPDGRHTFDLLYTLVVRNAAEPQLRFVAVNQRLSIGDPPPTADVIDLGEAPGEHRAAIGRWREVAATRYDHYGQPNPDIPPGHRQTIRAHYRINARPDQFADVAIGFELDHAPHRGWFRHQPERDFVAQDEEAQLGAVVRAHCPLGVKIQNGETRSLCAS